MSDMRIRVWAVVSGLSLGLTACGGTGTVGQDRPPGTASVTGESAPQDAEGGTPVAFVIGGGVVVRATVWHNPTGRALLERLPVTVTLADHRNQEKGGALPRPLTMDGMPAGADPRAGDLGYFAPTNDLVLYYADAPYWAGIARIGRIEGDLSVVAMASGDATVQRSA